MYNNMTTNIAIDYDPDIVSKIRGYMDELKKASKVSNDRARKGVIDPETEAFWIYVCSEDDVKATDGCKVFQRLWQSMHCLENKGEYCSLLKASEDFVNSDKICGRSKKILNVSEKEDRLKRFLNDDRVKTWRKLCCSLDWDFSDKAFESVRNSFKDSE